MWTMMVSHGKQTMNAALNEGNKKKTDIYTYTIKYPHDISKTVARICEKFMFSVTVPEVFTICLHTLFFSRYFGCCAFSRRISIRHICYHEMIFFLGFCSFVVHISLEIHVSIYIQWSSVKLLWMDFHKRFGHRVGHTTMTFRGLDRHHFFFFLLKEKQ